MRVMRMDRIANKMFINSRKLSCAVTGNNGRTGLVFMRVYIDKIYGPSPNPETIQKGHRVNFLLAAMPIRV